VDLEPARKLAFSEATIKVSPIKHALQQVIKVKLMTPKSSTTLNSEQQTLRIDIDNQSDEPGDGTDGPRLYSEKEKKKRHGKAKPQVVQAAKVNWKMKIAERNMALPMTDAQRIKNNLKLVEEKKKIEARISKEKFLSEQKLKERNALVNDEMIYRNAAPTNVDRHTPALENPVYPNMQRAAVLDSEFMVNCSSSTESERDRFDNFVAGNLKDKDLPKPVLLLQPEYKQRRSRMANLIDKIAKG